MKTASDRWCDVLDRIEKIADDPLTVLRRMARPEGDTVAEWANKTRGQCLAAILDVEFSDSFDTVF